MLGIHLAAIKTGKPVPASGSASSIHGKKLIDGPRLGSTRG
jgi:hypothetical protein